MRTTKSRRAWSYAVSLFAVAIVVCSVFGTFQTINEAQATQYECIDCATYSCTILGGACYNVATSREACGDETCIATCTKQTGECAAWVAWGVITCFIWLDDCGGDWCMVTT